MQEEINDFKNDVIRLHYIANRIESHIGKGQLSEDLRKLADRLHEITEGNYHVIS